MQSFPNKVSVKYMCILFRIVAQKIMYTSQPLVYLRYTKVKVGTVFF